MNFKTKTYFIVKCFVYGTIFKQVVVFVEPKCDPSLAAAFKPKGTGQEQQETQ